MKPSKSSKKSSRSPFSPAARGRAAKRPVVGSIREFVGESIELLETRQFLSAVTSTAISDTITVTPNVATYATSTSSIKGYTPAQIRAAYGFDDISGDGTGQTIAIVDAYNDPNIASDLATFNKTFNLSSSDFSVVSQTGGSVSSIATDGDWSGEIALDVEWAHAAAPGADIVLVEAKDDSLTNLLAAAKYAATITDVSVVSMSWGTSEFSGETKYDSYFTTPSGHQPVTFVASSGDNGAGASWPAIATNVLSVGGTTITTTGTGSATTITSETAWSYSGGGASRYETAPSYQSSVTGSSTRTTPDVSINANPSSGYAVYSSIADSSGNVGWSVVGGTSAGAPQWAGLVAIADQARNAAGKTTLDTAGTLTTLYSTLSSSTTYSANFDDITSGSNGRSFGGFGGWGRGGGRFGSTQTASTTSATTGYDRVTGLGSPNVAALVKTLSGTTSTKTTTTTTKTTTTTARATRAIAVAETTLIAGPTTATPFASKTAISRLTAEVETALATTSAAAGNGSGRNSSGTAVASAAGDFGGSADRTGSHFVPTLLTAANETPQHLDPAIVELNAQSARPTSEEALAVFSRRLIDDESNAAAQTAGAMHRRVSHNAMAGLFSTTELSTSSDRTKVLVAGLVILTAAQIAARKHQDKRQAALRAAAVGADRQ